MQTGLLKIKATKLGLWQTQRDQKQFKTRDLVTFNCLIFNSKGTVLILSHSSTALTNQLLCSDTRTLRDSPLPGVSVISDEFSTLLEITHCPSLIYSISVFYLGRLIYINVPEKAWIGNKSTIFYF